MAVITIEQVEKLREKAKVSYDDAKAALEAADGDLLDALIYLEKQGKVETPEGDGYYNSKNNLSQSTEKDQADNNYRQDEGNKGQGFKQFIKKIGKLFAVLIHKGNTNSFEIIKNDEVKASLPVTALVMLLLFVFWVTLPLIIIGLFFGYRYRFTGPDLGRQTVNDAMDEVANTADKIKHSFTENK